VSNRLRSRLSFANVVSCLALFVALGGSTYAAISLPKKSVGTKQLKKNAVTKAKIKKNAITTAKIRANAVTGAKVKESTLSTVPSANMANTANVASSLTPPEGWHEVGAPGEPLFENGYKNNGGEFSTAAFFKDHEGMVHLKGTLDVGTPNSAAFTLPPGYRPLQKTFGQAAHTNTNDASIQVSPSGGVEIHTGGSSSAGLDGFTFRAES
jgi:hypothetical protein